MKEPYKVIATKVAPDTAAKLERLAEAIGQSKYSIIAVIIDAVVKAATDEGEQSAALRELLHTFFDVDKVRAGFTLSGYRVPPLAISKALAIVSPAKNESAAEVVLYERRGDEEALSRNEDRILTEFLAAFSPALLSSLEAYRKESNIGSLKAALLSAVAETRAADPIAEDVAELFADNDIVEYSAGGCSRLNDSIRANGFGAFIAGTNNINRFARRAVAPGSRCTRTMINSMEAYERSLQPSRFADEEYGEDPEALTEETE